MKSLVVGIALSLAACAGVDGGQGGDLAGPPLDAAIEQSGGGLADVAVPPTDGPLPRDSASPPDGAPDHGLPPPLARGLAWVRANPMFVSGLAVQMGAPSASAVDDYFTGFKANAIHLWENGLPNEVGDWRKHAGAGMRFVSWVNKNGTSLDGGKVAGGIAPNTPGRIGFQVGDEPVDWAEYNAMVAGAKKVRAADPAGLIIFNFTYRHPELDKVLTDAGTQSEMDVYSYDAYTRSNGAYEHLARYRAAGLKHGRPYWRYIRGYLPSASSKDALSESDARWDAFSGLVYGYTGHSWFLYQVAAAHNLEPAFFGAAGSYSAPKTPAFAMAAQINAELRQLGRVVTQLTSTEVRYTPSIGFLQPKGTQPFTPGAGGDPYLQSIHGTGGAALDSLVGFFRDDAGERYVMLQNVKHTHGAFPVNLAVGPVIFELDFDFSNGPSVDPTKVESLDKTSGQVKALALAAVGGGKARLTTTIAAGDVLLFKYASGKPFASGP